MRKYRVELGERSRDINGDLYMVMGKLAQACISMAMAAFCFVSQAGTLLVLRFLNRAARPSSCIRSTSTVAFLGPHYCHSASPRRLTLQL